MKRKQALLNNETGYTCKCLIFHKYPAYVYAHQNDELVHTCSGCGRQYSIINLVASLIQDEKSPEEETNWEHIGKFKDYDFYYMHDKKRVPYYRVTNDGNAPVGFGGHYNLATLMHIKKVFTPENYKLLLEKVKR